MGIPQDTDFTDLEDVMDGFCPRDRTYNPLRYKSVTDEISDEFVAEEFSKEALRVSIQKKYFSEMSDIDGIFWGEQYTYPIEIKEKTFAEDKNLGEYFGLDVGPFVKLAFYAAKKGNLHSLFIVREIDSVEHRQLVGWKAITYEKLAQFASWVPMGGGQNMQGGGSTVVRIPKHEFSDFSESYIKAL